MDALWEHGQGIRDALNGQDVRVPIDCAFEPLSLRF